MPQVSFSLQTGTIGVGDLGRFWLVFSCIAQHVGGAGCLHPPVTNKVWFGRIEILVSAVEICISSKA